MDIVGSSLSAAQTLLTALRCPQLKDIPEIIGYESKLEDLKDTVEAVTAVLRDAERKKNELPEQTQFQIEKLKDAVFEADDLLDEFVTLAEQKRILNVEGRLSQKLGSFFSSSNPLSVALRMSKGVKKILKKLDVIVYNKQFNLEGDPEPNKQFNFEHDPEPIRKLNRETCSYVNEVDIIGRQDDLEQIVGMLPDVQRDDVSFLSIVGIGGLGKTALAQLVFNNERVASAFPLRLWTCVADQDQKQLNLTEILRMILTSARGTNIDKGFTLDQIQSQLRQELVGKRYLLVLDDVWTENRTQWCDLVQYLIGGAPGSWIVVTTRSVGTATIIHGEVYKLQGLPQENSWRLFQKMAFTSDELNPPDELVNIGRNIVDGCAGVPLAIRVAGSLVYGQEKRKWLSVQKNGFAHTRDDENTIMPILKLSYHHLEPPLKSCFSYCALFPKDYQIQKEMLISLWMAQGYIVPLYYGQSIGDAAEEYFSILLKRCFFQDIKKNGFGEVIMCKIHDLMHDIAQSVSRKEIFALSSSNIANIDNIKVRHLSIAGTREYGKCPLSKSQIRSHLFVDQFNYIIDDGFQFPVEALVANYKWVRALDLSRLDIESLPSTIGELLHLRYLDLSDNIIEMLPNSITKLCNLQTLKLDWCSHLKELPKDVNRLIKLRVLGIFGCLSLAHMPRGMGKLSSLERLEGCYILGCDGNNNCSTWKEWFNGLEDLNTHKNLKGNLWIRIRWPDNAENKKVWKGEEDSWSWSWKAGSNSLLRNMEHLNFLRLELFTPECNRESGDRTVMDLLIEVLQPHSNLKKLEVWEYTGVKMPVWFSNVTALPHLVSLSLNKFNELEYLPLLLPSLKKIYLEQMPKLRGLGAEESSSSSSSRELILPCLSELTIYGCPKLTCLTIMAPQLRHMSIDGNVGCLNSYLMEMLKNIQFMGIKYDGQMVDLPNYIQYCSSLEELEINHWRKLESIPNWMPKLTSLQKLKLNYCSQNLERRCQTDPPGEDWPYIQHIPHVTNHGSQQ